MKVHNIMEEFVIQRVNSLYDQIKRSNPSWLSCDCENCRLDSISYVLNRIEPKYVISGRGMTHSISTIEDSQIRADVDALGLEGIRIVSATKRPYHHDIKPEITKTPEPVFNMPTFIGTVFDGSTFEPLTGAKITLKYDDKIAEMIDMTWQNPAKTFKSTQGAYSFWAKAVPAEEAGIARRFTFTVEVEAPEYTPAIHSFEVPIVSEAVPRTELNSTFTLKIKDMILFRSDIATPMDDEDLL